jgi:hypothetical protein
MDQSPDSPGTRRRPVRSNPHQTVTRWNTGDYSKLVARAERAGMNVSSFIRVRTLETPTTPSRRQATVELQALAKALAMVNKMGGNLHQIARHLNFHGIPYPDEIVTALRGYEEMVGAILAAMGREP